MDNMMNNMEETMNKPYTLRRLKDRDLYPVLEIIGKVFPDDLAPIFVRLVTKESTLEELGAIAIMKLVVAVIRNIHVVHDELYAFLADVSGIPAAEIEEMEFGTSPSMIWDIVANEKNNSFFKVVSKLS